MFNALSDFLIYCRVERRLADLTCRAYERDVRACLDFLRAQGIAALAEIRTPDLRRFLAQEATHRPAASSQARTVAALRCFFRFCVQGDYLERDPAHVLRTPKKREALPDVLDRAELSRLLDVPGKVGVWARVHAGKRERDRLLLALFAYGGLRRSELLGLDCEDVDLNRRLIRVRKAKGSRERAVPIHPGLVALFLAYGAARPSTSDPALFLGARRERRCDAHFVSADEGPSARHGPLHVHYDRPPIRCHATQAQTRSSTPAVLSAATPKTSGLRTRRPAPIGLVGSPATLAGFYSEG
jgi:site-specific recombinase XerD